MSFKKRSNSAKAALNEQLAKQNDSGSNGQTDDGTEWKLTTDKKGNGSAVIRFLPNSDDDKIAFVKKYQHSWQNDGGRWFIENCATTIGGECPLCEANSELWNTGVDSNKKMASKRKRKLSYWSNVYVVKDSSNPDSEGKVFKYRFGTKIFEKIMSERNDDEDLGTVGYDVECPFDGANFALKVKKVEGYANYDESKFGKVAALLGGDEDKLEEVFNSMHDIDCVVAEDVFKSPTEFQKRLDKFLGGKSKAITSAAESLEEINTDSDSSTNAIDEIAQADEIDSSGDELDALLAELD